MIASMMVNEGRSGSVEKMHSEKHDVLGCSLRVHGVQGSMRTGG